jgi:hypothetical protein
MYLLANLAMLPAFAFWWYIATWFIADPGKYVVFSVILLNVIAWALGRSVTWIVATGSDSSGQPVRAWFADGRNQGWAAVLGATARMHQSVLQALRPGPPGRLTGRLTGPA